MRWMLLLVSLAGFAASNADLRLVQAVKKRDHEAARSLMTQRVDVNAQESMERRRLPGLHTGTISTWRIC